jgi:hypothetical protein
VECCGFAIGSPVVLWCGDVAISTHKPPCKQRLAGLGPGAGFCGSCLVGGGAVDGGGGGLLVWCPLDGGPWLGIGG